MDRKPSALRPTHLQAAAAVLGLLLVLPSVDAGFFADDYLQLAQLEKWSVTPAAAWDLYSFVPRDSLARARLVEQGTLPYFTPPDLRITFLRPLSSGLMWLDHQLFGRAPLGYHVHTLLWYAALLAVVLMLYRRLLTPTLVTLAFVIFAFSPGHAMAASWVAARNATVSCVFVFAAWLAHRRWRAEGWRPGAVLAPLAVALGLAAGEMALGAVAYVWAWELVERRSRWKLAIAPSLIVAVFYLGLHRAFGMGARQSAAYLDPFGDPVGFLRLLPQRLFLLASHLWTGAPIDLVTFDQRLVGPLAVAGAVASVMVAIWLPKALRRLDGEEARSVRVFLLGAIGATLISTPAMPGGRVMLAASLGGSVVLGVLLRDAWRAFYARQARALAVLGLLALGPVHLLVAPIALTGNVFLLRTLFQDARQVVADAEIRAPVPGYVVIVAFHDLLPMDLAVYRAFHGRLTLEQLRILSAREPELAGSLPLPDETGYLGSTVLSLSPAPHRIRRTASDEFELFTTEGTLLDGAWAECVRVPGLKMPAGTVVRAAFFTAAVRAANPEGKPTRVAFRFHRTLEDPSLVFLHLVGGQLRRLAMPPPGGEMDVVSVRVPPGLSP